MNKKKLGIVTLSSAVILAISVFQYNKQLHKPDLALEAVLSHNVEATRFLIVNGYDINKRYQGGNTLLHSAALNGDLQMVKMLVGLGAKLQYNDSLNTAIVSARDFDNEEVAAYLTRCFNK